METGRTNLYTDALAQPGSKARRKEYRRKIRNLLGRSNDPAPTYKEALDAARELAALMDAASGGRFGLAVHDFRSGDDIPFGDAVTRWSDVCMVNESFYRDEAPADEERQLRADTPRYDN